MKRQFHEYWPDRIDGLFEAGVDFASKSVLDVGCNMGVIGYELSKHGIADYHGVDFSEAHVEVAKAIFDGVKVPHRFDCFNYEDLIPRRTALSDRYDIVLYLAVHHHIQRTGGRQAAAQALGDTLHSCRSTFIFRGPKDPDLDRALETVGFHASFTKRHPILYPLTVYTKE